MDRICFGNFSSLLVISIPTSLAVPDHLRVVPTCLARAHTPLSGEKNPANELTLHAFLRPSFVRLFRPPCSGQWTKSGYTDLADHALIGNMCVPFAGPVVTRSMLIV